MTILPPPPLHPTSHYDVSSCVSLTVPCGGDPSAEEGWQGGCRDEGMDGMLSTLRSRSCYPECPATLSALLP